MLIPVSYTHLDVYKRQWSSRFYFMQREDEACIEQDLIMIVITRKLAKNVTAVFILHHREKMCIRDRDNPEEGGDDVKSSCPL